MDGVACTQEGAHRDTNANGHHLRPGPHYEAYRRVRGISSFAGQPSFWGHSRCIPIEKAQQREYYKELMAMVASGSSDTFHIYACHACSAVTLSTTLIEGVMKTLVKTHASRNQRDIRYRQGNVVDMYSSMKATNLLHWFPDL